MSSPIDLLIEVPGGPVSATSDGPTDSSHLVVLAHGAGAPKDHPFMLATAAGLGARGIRVLRFNFLYVEAGRKAPDRAAVLEETFRTVVDRARQEGAQRLVIGGKSMGGRIASQIAAGPTGVVVDGLVFLGYPLHPPGRPDRIRDAHLTDVKAPMLFVEGTRDPFCPLPTLEGVLQKVRSPYDLVVIEDGDHSFKVRKSSGRSSTEALEELIESVASWVLAR
jgi:predicted alpha/beta-hydrolase family hydrolase